MSNPPPRSLLTIELEPIETVLHAHNQFLNENKEAEW
jgi:hypothetical protein